MTTAAERIRIPWNAAGDVAVLALFSLALRVSTFGMSELTWDETAFALVAREILHGQWPFTTAFDHKPIALYLHFAAAFGVFGDNPTATRILGWIVVTATAIAVRAILAGPIRLPRLNALLISGTLLVASVGFEGQAAMSEHFANLYCVLCVLCLLRRRPVMAMVAGACAAIGINSNYLAAPVIAGLLAGFLAQRDFGAADRIRALALFIAGAAASTALVLSPIYLFSTPENYFGPQMSFLLGYPAPITALNRLSLFLSAAGSLVPLVATGIAVLALQRRSPAVDPIERPSLRAFCGMTIGACLAVLASGYVYGHYMLLVLPPLWLWGGAVLAEAPDPSPRILFGAAVAGTSLSTGMPGLLTAGVGLEDLIGKSHGDLSHDQPRAVARIAATRLPQGGTVYAIGCAPLVLYQLLHVRPPTRYPFYMHVFIPRFASALGVDPRSEVQAVFAKRPAVVVIGDISACEFPPSGLALVNAAIQQHGYKPYARFEGTTFFAAPMSPGATSGGSPPAIDRSGLSSHKDAR